VDIPQPYKSIVLIEVVVDETPYEVAIDQSPYLGVNDECGGALPPLLQAAPSP
jgi:hypothetical protein